jgi:hypothetical protein
MCVRVRVLVMNRGRVRLTFMLLGDSISSVFLNGQILKELKIWTYKKTLET